jgi:hypothetical protein
MPTPANVTAATIAVKRTSELAALTEVASGALRHGGRRNRVTVRNLSLTAGIVRVGRSFGEA